MHHASPLLLCLTTGCNRPKLLLLHHAAVLQVLEGAGNHYHFILPGDMAINATRLLQEVDGPAASCTAPEPKGECAVSSSRLHGQGSVQQAQGL
jgi:hypothetical protein